MVYSPLTDEIIAALKERIKYLLKQLAEAGETRTHLAALLEGVPLARQALDYYHATHAVEKVNEHMIEATRRWKEELAKTQALLPHDTLWKSLGADGYNALAAIHPINRNTAVHYIADSVVPFTAETVSFGAGTPSAFDTGVPNYRLRNFMEYSPKFRAAYSPELDSLIIVWVSD